MKRIISAAIILILVLLAAVSITRAAAPGNPCLLFGALTTPAQDVRFFAADLKQGVTSLLGEPVPYSDVAGVAIHPGTGVLYALLAPHGGGGFYLVSVDRVTGAVSRIGATGLSQAGGLAIRPTDGTLWTWAHGMGPATIDPATGVAHVVSASNAVATDLAWRPDGMMLFTAGMRVLRTWDPISKSLMERSQLPITVSGITMRADGRLLLSAPRPGSGLSADTPPGLDRDFSLLILNPETGSIDATIESPPVPLSTLPEVAASKVETLTWAVNCGNPSPGGPADLIQSVSVAPQSVCPGGTVRVVVETSHPDGGANPVNVTINGLPGASRWVQFEGLPGPRTVRVAASTAEGYHDAEEVQAQVSACDPAAVLPILRVRQDPYHPGAAAFEVQNADVVAPPGSIFLWEFGDGTTAQGTVPFVRHSYAAAMPRDVEFPTFNAAVSVTRPGGTMLRTSKTVALWNRYVADKRRGVIRPPVQADEVVPLISPPSAMIRSIQPRSAGYTLRNIEDHSITLTAFQVEHQHCDPTRNPLYSAWEPLSVSIGAGEEVTQQVTLPDNEEICGVALHLVGTADLLHTVAADVYFETRRNPHKTHRVSDAALLDALNAAASLSADPDRIFDEELFQLSRELRIPHPGGGAYVPPANFEPDPYVGQECLPGDPPPYGGITCQATDPPEWTTAEPHIRNALKGDVILSTVCGFVGDLLRAVSPPQYYSHSGIMTSHHYTVAHSTASSSRYLHYPEGGGEMTDGVEEGVLKYGWPGVMQQSVGDAFSTVTLADPNGIYFDLHGFSQNPARCPEDELVTYPMVVRPPADQAALVRPMLEQAGEIAAATPPGNYRLYAYTDSRIAAEETPEAPSAMCSSFVWRTLRKAGVLFEGAELEPEDVQTGASVAVDGLTDGLYAYDEFDRLNAGIFINTSIHDQVYAQAGWFGEALTDAADDLANQFTNCFASDWCGGESKDSEAWMDPGVGRAVSPQDMFYWDSPATGGAFGSHEPLVYRSGDHVRVYRWARTEGAGDVRGAVMLNGVGFADAHVVLYGDMTRETASGPDGKFSFLGVPSGEYQVVAQKQDGNVLLEATGTVVVPMNGTGTITLTLTPPPEYLRRLTFQGTFLIEDDESPAPDEYSSGIFYEVCNVDPYARTAQINWPPAYAYPYCAGDEVVPIIDITCELMPDNTTVRWHGAAKFYCQGDCNPTDLDGYADFDHQISLNQIKGWNIHLHNDDPSEASYDDAWILLTVTNGNQ